MDDFRMNLQLFAEPAGAGTTPAGTGAEPTGAGAEPAGNTTTEPAAGGAQGGAAAGHASLAELLKADKGMQSEVDKLVAKAIKTTQDKAQQGQTEMEQLREQIKAMQDRADKAERAAAIVKAGVDERYQKFVAFEAAANVSDTVDFPAALAAYLTANPQYLTPRQAEPGMDPAAQALLQTLGSAGGKTADKMTDAEYFAMRRAQQTKK